MSSKNTTDTLVAKRVIVSGKVQGVGFRYGLAEVARGLQIWGWCRNVPDGTVEAFLQGEAGRVGQALEWIRQGPPGARVQQVLIEDQAVLDPMLEETIQVFEIRR